MNALLFPFVIAGLVFVQQALYFCLIDRDRVEKLQNRQKMLMRLGDPDLIEKNRSEFMFLTSFPAVVSSFVILFSFPFIEANFKEAIVRLPFKIPAIVRGFPPFGMRDYFGWLYICTFLLILFSIIIGRIAWKVKKGLNSRQFYKELEWKKSQ